MKQKIILMLTAVIAFTSTCCAQHKNASKTGTPPFKNLVGSDWKGIVWEPYDDDWNSNGTTSDGREIVDCGIKWVRPWVNANDSFKNVDAMIKQCKKSNLQIVLCFNKSNPGHDLGSADQQAAEVAKLKLFVGRYKKDVHYWEIQNEANLDHSWNLGKEVGRGGNDPNSPYNAGVRRYVTWLRLAYNTIKAEDPYATVILGGVSNWIMEDFMDRFTIEEGYKYCDEVAFHPYAVNNRSFPDECISRLKSFQDKMSKWPAPKNDMPIWITEIGFHTGNITSPGIVKDEALKASYLQETMQKLIQNLHYSRPVFWYIYHEKEAVNTYFSLVKKYKDNGKVITEFLPAYYTFKNMDKSWSYYTKKRPD